MPRLLTRMSTSGNCATSASQPAASPRSNAAACTLADGAACLHLRHRLGDGRLLAAVDDDLRAHLRKPDGGGEPNAARRAGDERRLACQVEIHALPPIDFSVCVIWPAARRRCSTPSQAPAMPSEEPAGGDHHALAIGGMELHPRLAFFQLPVAGFADADEAGALGFLERGQARRPRLVRRQRRRMIGAVEGDGLAGIGIGRDHRPARMKPRAPHFGQFAREFGTRPVGRAFVALLAQLIGDDLRRSRPARPAKSPARSRSGSTARSAAPAAPGSRPAPAAPGRTAGCPSRS